MPKTMSFVPRDPSQKKILRIQHATSRSSNCTPGKPLRNKTKEPQKECGKSSGVTKIDQMNNMIGGPQS